MLYKWRPIAHDGQLISDPQRYARARIVLQRRNETRGLVDEDMNLYVVACTPRTTTLVVVLWASYQPDKLAHFRALRAWHTEHLPRRALLGAHHLVDEDERKAWWRSTVW